MKSCRFVKFCVQNDISKMSDEGSSMLSFPPQKSWKKKNLETIWTNIFGALRKYQRCNSTQGNAQWRQSLLQIFLEILGHLCPNISSVWDREMSVQWAQKTRNSLWKICLEKSQMALNNQIFMFCFVLSWLHHVACGILVPWPGIESVPPAVEAWSLNHWTAREVPIIKL